jgi:cellulose synthase/poly-beta-1,6-N-acetylglucosamine synthase-like glycosyltransferase
VYDLKFEFVNASAFVLCVTFCAYVVSILIVYLRQAATPRGDGSGYSWHVIVPCLNEAAVIADTVRDLLNNFPDLVVWCVDDGSDDGTDEILAGLVHPRLHVVRRNLPEARQGKGAALNAGWRALRASLSPGTDTSRVLVGVVDADSRLDPNFRDVLAGPAYFGSSRVEAVQIEVRMINRRRRYRGVRASAWGRLLVTLQDMEFRGPIAAMQQLRKHTGSVGLGGNGQFTRLSALNMIAERYGTPWHGALLEDFELGLHVLLTGGRTEYCAETWVAQEGLTRIRALVRQRSRWSQGCMQCLRYLPQIFRSRRLGNSAVLEIAYFLAAPWIQLVGTVIYAACLGIMAWYAATEFGGFDSWWRHGGWAVAPLVVLFGILPFAVWGPVYRARIDRRVTRLRAFGLGLAYWLYSYVQSAAVWYAFLRLVRMKTDWQKTIRIGTYAAPAGRRVQPRPS